ncbi:nucleotidyltransferase family protein [Nafulsella turpanensis]|uniref:nucleotidyltransferase family protein n=1 Tax=Nafulsella turpanensis TaxID=1265690 RepID=UPI00034B942B|nr:nucleotidyltransferase family protein [Nafulsella turpanensis]
MTGTIILAAGASTRLGEPKQCLAFGGKTLLQKALQAAGESCKNTVVVLGAHAKSILPIIEKEAVHVVHNEHWQEGMASSIRKGLEALLRLAPQTTEVIVMLCDQPFADTSLLNRLIAEKNRTGKGIIASAYEDTAGVPVLFDKKFFPELLSLRGREGAKKLLSRHPEALTTIPFPLGAIDIDTAADYQALLHQRERHHKF